MIVAGGERHLVTGNATLRMLEDDHPLDVVVSVNCWEEWCVVDVENERLVPQ